MEEILSESALLPIALYGLTGMFFSEVLVWNAKHISRTVSARGPLVFPPLPLAAYFIYFLLRACFLRIAARHGASRPVELLIEFEPRVEN